LFNYEKFIAIKKERQKKFVVPSFFVVVASGIRDPGSEIENNQDPGSVIKTFRIRNTGPRTLLESLVLTCVEGADALTVFVWRELMHLRYLCGGS
jgi:hypothetical protein